MVNLLCPPCATALKRIPLQASSTETGGKEGLQRGRGSGVVFDKGDGCQLFAELLQHDHPLQKSHVVDATTTNTKVRGDHKTATQKTSLETRT